MRILVSTAVLAAAAPLACGSPEPVPMLEDPESERAGFSSGGVALSIDDRYIVTFASPTRGARTVAAHGARVELDIPSVGGLAVSADPDEVDALAEDPNVESVEPDPRRYPLAQILPFGIPMVQAPAVSDLDAANTTVCVIDSGLSLPHEDFDAADVTASPGLGAGDPFDDSCGHGTHVTGTIAALGNSDGVVGVLPGGNLNVHIVKIFSRVVDRCNYTYGSSLINALAECVANTAPGTRLVVNMSLGGESYNPAEESAFALAYGSGVLSVAAAGNSGNTALSYPASYDSVISVAAIDSDLAHASFSQRNGQVELAAPGVSVLSTMDPTSLYYGDGLSQLALDQLELDSRPLVGAPEGNVSAPSVNCGLGTSPCAGAAGSVCVIGRGTNSFAEKVLNCQAGGGVAAVVYNDAAGFFDGTLGGAVTTIPSLSTSDAIGAELLGAIGAQVGVVIDGDAPYTRLQGTSMATPHVAGGAALLWSRFPALSNQQIRDALATTALDLGNTGRDPLFGHGLIQLGAAYEYLSPCTVVALEAVPNRPQPAFTPVEFRAVTQGCTKPRFRFSYRPTSGGPWTAVQNSKLDTVTLALPADRYRLRVQVKEAGVSGWDDKHKKTHIWR